MRIKWTRVARSVVCAAAVFALAACAAEPKQPEAARPAPPPAAPEVEAPPPPAPPTAEAKTEAQKRAQEALESLQNGEEDAARGMLEQALKLDPANELAGKLLPQITRDARQEFGPQSFPYTVQRGDSLATLAQRFLGDRFKFYSLAKYNDIKVPNRLAAGQTIRIPGKQPPPQALKPPAKPEPVKPEPPKPEPVAEPAKPEPTPAPPPKPKVDEQKEAADALVAQGRALEKKGDLYGAMRAFDEARKRVPGDTEATRLYQSARKRLIDNLDREATSLYSKQDLKGAIAKWDELLALDPGNRLATLKRAQAIELQKKADEFGRK